MNDSDQSLRRILLDCRSIAVVGLSANPGRPSYGVAAYLQAHGYRIVPVNPTLTVVLGQTCYPTLEAIPFAIDMVDVFRKPEEVLAVAQSAVAIGAKCFWQQLGLANEDAHKLALEAGMDAVLNRCVKIEHARLLG